MFLPTPLFIGLIGPLAGKLSDRFGGKAPASAGLLICIVSFLSISLLSSQTSVWKVLVCFSGVGIGAGLFNLANNSAIFASVPSSELGVAVSLANLGWSFGQTLGIAMATLAVTLTMSHEGLPPVFSPHNVNTYPYSKVSLDEMFLDVQAEERRRVLVTTPCKWFGLDPEKDLTPTPK